MNKPKLYVLSGAGLDAGSGVNTFRDEGGTWETHKLEDVCYLPRFENNYKYVHEFYNERRNALKYVIPCDAHRFIAEMQKKYGVERVVNITTNVSNLLEDAGVQDVLHIHGNITKMVDYKSENKREWDIGYEEYDVSKDKNEYHYDINAKPAVVFFGEDAPHYQTMASILSDIQPQDTVIVVGAQLSIVDFVGWFLSTTTANVIMIDPAISRVDPDSPTYDITHTWYEMESALHHVNMKVPMNAVEGFEKIRDHITTRMGEL